MTDLSELTELLVDKIRETEEFSTYKKTLQVIKENSSVYERVEELLSKNYELQKSEPEDMIDLMDALTKEYEDVINIEAVGEFLEAEAAYSHLVREVNRRVVQGLESD